MITINGIQIEPQKYVDKWTDWALEATPATDKQVTENVQWLYANAGLDKPDVVIFREYEQFLAFDWNSVRASVRASVRDSVRDSVWASVRASVRASVWDSVETSVETSVRDSVWASVETSVETSVRDSVWASVRASVRASVWDSVETSVETSVGTWYWADDLAFADVFVDTNVLNKAKADELAKYKQMLSTQRIAVYTENVCYVLVAPVIQRNENGLLHSTDGLAVKWGDSGLYYLNGVQFQKALWERVVSGEMQLGEILKIEDVDQRTQAFRYVNNPKDLFEHAKAEVLDEYTKIALDGTENYYALYRIPQGEIFTEDAYYMYFNCPTTGKNHMEGVEVSKTVADAMAWAMSTNDVTVTPEQWKALVPLQDEN